MTETRDLEKLNNYLTKNNNEKINDFINGYITVGDIKKEADINHKYLVYYALKKIVPDAQEQRENKQKQRKARNQRRLQSNGSNLLLPSGFSLLINIIPSVRPC